MPDELRTAITLREVDGLSYEEIAEQNVAVAASKVGVMGRAEDQAILQADRDTAMRAYDLVQKYNSKNNLGESRGAPKEKK